MQITNRSNSVTIRPPYRGTPSSLERALTSSLISTLTCTVGGGKKRVREVKNKKKIFPTKSLQHASTKRGLS